MTPAEVAAAAKGYRQRQDEAAWLLGRYTLEALCAALSAALSGKRGNTYQYPDRPYSSKADRSEADETAFARAYMMQMVRAGKGWGKTNLVNSI